jgi:hypothetical protein
VKKTHMSAGEYDQSWKRFAKTGPIRRKHSTVCGTVCDYTKATTDANKVTCHYCLRRMSK